MSEKDDKELNKLSKQDNRQTINLIEAALYVAGRPLEIKTLGSILKIRSKRRITELTKTIAEEYLNRNGALELIELTDGRFVLQLKPYYISRVRRLAMRPLLSTGPLKTIAYIAYRQPVTQSHIVRVRGQHAYDHIGELEELGLITSEELGKTKIVTTTKAFADYFNLSSSLKIMRRQLEAMFEAVGEIKEGESNTTKKLGNNSTNV